MGISSSDYAAIVLTLKLATTVTFLLLILATPVAVWLARTRHWSKGLINAMVTLPLVLPPSVLGFYLLLMMGPEGPLGKLTNALGLPGLAFSFWGLVIASCIYSLPFVVQPIQNAVSAIGPRPLEVAATLRASPLDRFFSVTLPMAKPGFITAAILGFAHTLGEFGVVLMIGGNIPGETQVISVLIYEHVESLDYSRAHWLSGLMIAISLVVLMALTWHQRKAATATQGNV